jgi:hypothetical protein
MNNRYVCNFLLTLSVIVLVLNSAISVAENVAKETPEKKEHWADQVDSKNVDIGDNVPAKQSQGAEADLKQVSKSIQELKQNVITLNKDLRLMEEKLLFPSSTKYTIFVSVSSGTFFTLESIKLKLDGKLVSTQLYSEKQRQAMLRGGVHKLYVTNLNEGDHTATLFFTGLGSGGRDYKRASTIEFKKGPAGEYLEVAISDDSVTQEPVFSIKQW